MVDYLARSVSAFYAMAGGLAWLVSGDLGRHTRVVAYLGWMGVVFGLAVLAIDLVAGLPAFWTAVEGPATVVLGLVVLILVRKLPPCPKPPAADRV